MSTQVTLTLPDDVLHEAQQAAARTSRQVTEVLADSVTSFFQPLVVSSELADFAQMPDDEVLRIADSEMPRKHSRRMSELLDLQREGTIGRMERAELRMLMQFYQTGQLLKTNALVEAVRRGLRERLSP